ncbi:MAG TPA: GNAT family N-acetyltransferase [Lachnospiraceae bacterium]|nr:GNAT family N-acetyltransferase [Lachnospiraceae bacterium]
MKYKYVTNVRDDDTLRASFNELTQKTFCFNFINWYENGFWGDKYIPHVLVDGEKVISNISVNLMQFDMCGQVKKYIQLGTVMTDPAYRGQGLNKYIMENILEEYKGKVDGIYLFGNDSVLDYYPKFGFCPINEYEYAFKWNEESQPSSENKLPKYLLEKLNLSQKAVEDKLYQDIKEYEVFNLGNNPNEAFALYDNMGLFQFWLAEEYRENVYYLSEVGAYVLAKIESGILWIYQIISKSEINLQRLAVSFDEKPTEVKLSFTPVSSESYNVKLHKVEDSTLFVIGDSLRKVDTNRMMFPVISHA